MARALKVLRSLPRAFIYTWAGTVNAPGGPAEKFTFVPDPNFDPPDLETEALSALVGELWVDPAHMRVVRMEGHLQQDVDFGWGVLGRLSKGGWIIIDQAEVLPGVWRLTKFQMDMTVRVLFHSRRFVTVEVESQFAPVPVGISYRDAIALLRGPTGTR